MNIESKENSLCEESTNIKRISIQISIDIDAVIRNYPVPGKEPEKPIRIKRGYGYMVVSNAADCKGQGTDALKFKANVGDKICIHAVSSSNNFDNCVLLYRLGIYSGKSCLENFENCNYYRKTAVPGETEKVLPGKLENVHFWFQEAVICKKGNESCNADLAVYLRNAEGKAQLFGYYTMRFNLDLRSGKRKIVSQIETDKGRKNI